MNEISLEDDALSFFFLKTGDGDSILIELPAKNEKRRYIVVDCNDRKNSKEYPKITDFLRLYKGRVDPDKPKKEIALLVATHPHSDHILGIKRLLENRKLLVNEYWDSGFRHTNDLWYNIILHLYNNKHIRFVRPTSGYYTILDDIEITVLAPSITLRNRYDTYGVNINNSSIVMKIDYKEKTVILAGDAQWDSWAKMTDEFRQYKKTDNPDLNFKIRKNYNPLKCNVLKVAHHGSKNGTSYEAVEQLKPNYAIVSCAEDGTHHFPHDVAMESLKETKTKIAETYKKGTILVSIYEKNSSTKLDIYQNVEVSEDGIITGKKFEEEIYEITCSECNLKNPKTANFCTKCGYNFGE